jgi:hypothetical protein
MQQRNRCQRPGDLISAEEIASWVYCPKQWRLENGRGLDPENVSVSRSEMPTTLAAKSAAKAGSGQRARKRAAKRFMPGG